MTSLQHWDHGFKSPFKSEVYFVSTTRFNDNKWGTKNPIMCRDPEFGPVRIRAFGTYSMRVTDAGKFMKEIVGTDGEFTAAEISVQVRNIMVQEVSRVLAGSQIPVLDMAANTADLGKLVTTAIAPTIANYGISIPEFYIENISLPEEVEKMLDKRTSMGIVGDLNKFSQFSAAEAMTTAAANPNGSMGAGLGMGMGMGVGMAGPWGAQPQPQAAPAAPPPPPVQVVWHIAANGQTTGPFSRATLGRMATDGTFSRTSLVWSAGMDGWKPASDITELAQLFTVMPPPPPPGT
jgi:membrane protease subunit (stomatin/prohibitin family)